MKIQNQKPCEICSSFIPRELQELGELKLLIPVCSIKCEHVRYNRLIQRTTNIAAITSYHLRILDFFIKNGEFKNSDNPELKSADREFCWDECNVLI